MKTTSSKTMHGKEVYIEAFVRLPRRAYDTRLLHVHKLFSAYFHKFTTIAYYHLSYVN